MYSIPIDEKEKQRAKIKLLKCIKKYTKQFGCAGFKFSVAVIFPNPCIKVTHKTIKSFQENYDIDTHEITWDTLISEIFDSGKRLVKLQLKDIIM